MSTELATIQDTQNQLDALLGNAQDSGEFIPTLKINSRDEDDEGNELKKGLLYVSGAGKEVFAKSVTFYPLFEKFRWMQWDQDANKYHRSLIVDNFKQEARDTLGTVRLGKPSSKVLAADPELAKRFKTVSTYRLVYGFVRYTGETAKGETVEVTNQPVVLQLKGSNYMPFQDQFLGKVEKMGKKIHNYSAEVTVKKDKSGGAVYFNFQYEPNLSKIITHGIEVIDTVQHMQTLIRNENDGIEKAYTEALSSKQSDEKAVGGVSKFLDLELNDDPDDSLPF